MAGIRHRGIVFAEQSAERLYTSSLPGILSLYLSPAEQILQWQYTPREQKMSVLEEHLASLKPRSVEMIAQQYGDLQQSSLRARAIELVIQYAVERGQLDVVNRGVEVDYRREVYAYQTVRDKKGVHGLSAEQQSAYGKRASAVGAGKAGRLSYQKGTGIHGLSTQERRKNAKKGSQAGSSKGGKQSYELERGVHGLSLDEIVANSSRGGLKAKKEKKGIFAEGSDATAAARAGAEARGQVIYSDAEKELIQSLVENTEYQLAGRYDPPRPSWERIAAAVTETYGVERNKMSVRKCYEKMRRRNE